jgi:hypothetical protein
MATGYTTMFVLALVPPLWRRIMDPRAVRARRQGEMGSEKYFSDSLNVL